MIGAALLMLAQTTAAAAPPERFSILADPCAGAGSDHGRDILVCGRTAATGPRIRLRDDRGVPDRAVPSNPELRATQAMALEAPPCAASLRGCTVGFGPPVMPAIKAAAGLVKAAFAKRADKTGRIPIDLGKPAAPIAAAAP